MIDLYPLVRVTAGRTAYEMPLLRTGLRSLLEPSQCLHPHHTSHFHAGATKTQDHVDQAQHSY